MVSVAFASVLVGVIVGIRLQYLFLVLAVAVVLTAIAGFAIMHRRGVEWTMIKIILTAAALQVGYLCGAAARSVIAAARE
ncbi:MAG: hypothetical protein ACLPKB_07425 [Xanthobacteraceae bacterium]